MPPIKKITPPEDEFFAHIKESLTGYEEAYVPGAWEEFSQARKKKRGLPFWLSTLSGAAAVLLAGTALFLFMNAPQPVQHNPTTRIKYQDPTSTKKPVVSPETPPFSAGPTSTKGQRLSSGIPENSSRVQNTRLAQGAVVKADFKLKSGLEVKFDVDAKANSDVPEDPNTIRDRIAANTAPAAKSDQLAEEKKSPSFQDFLANESKANKASANKNDTHKKEDKWAMGLMVAPSFGNAKKLNMGYGVSMDYALSDKFSLGSGISYNELAATKKPAGDNTFSAPTVSAIARSSKSLESTDAQLNGIDIPLEIKYKLTKKLYANVGISAFAIIDQKQSNNYVQQNIVQQSVSRDAGLTQQLATVMVAEKVSEPAAASEVGQSKYLGFYNLSFGFKQKISKRNTFAVEPFLKIPMKESSTQNLNLIGTGVKLKFDF